MRSLVELKDNFFVLSLPHISKEDLGLNVFMYLGLIHTRLKATRYSREDPSYRVFFLYSHFI